VELTQVGAEQRVLKIGQDLVAHPFVERHPTLQRILLVDHPSSLGGNVFQRPAEVDGVQAELDKGVSLVTPWNLLQYRGLSLGVFDLEPHGGEQLDPSQTQFRRF